MNFPALLLSVFAPVLGLFVRIRAFAVVAALVCAVGLPVGGSALAQSGESAPEWRVECEIDEWDDIPACEASLDVAKRGVNRWDIRLNTIRYHCNGTKSEGVFIVPESFLRGFESASGEWTSGEKAGKWFSLRKVQIRWDQETVSDAILMTEQEGTPTNRYDWLVVNRRHDWWGWERLKMTPTTLPNPIPLLQTKSQLRIRGEDGKVLTFPLAGAREAIAEAKRGCGL